MDSWKSHCALHGLYMEFIWTPGGVHQDLWLSVTNSNFACNMSSTCDTPDIQRDVGLIESKLMDAY